MITAVIIGMLFVSGLFIWMVSIHQRLLVLDENIQAAMSQIGLKLSGCFDLLTVLLNIMKSYAFPESEQLMEGLRSIRINISEKSTPKEIIGLETYISDVLEMVTILMRQYPELKTNHAFSKTLEAIIAYDQLVRTNRLSYNDAVTKLNRELNQFPIGLIAGILGYCQREYIEEQIGREAIAG